MCRSALSDESAAVDEALQSILKLYVPVGPHQQIGVDVDAQSRSRADFTGSTTNNDKEIFFTIYTLLLLTFSS